MNKKLLEYAEFAARYAQLHPEDKMVLEPELKRLWYACCIISGEFNISSPFDETMVLPVKAA